MIDLHAHTTASDGSFSPTELVELAAQRGLKAVGVTDHDTIAGWPEAMAAGDRLGVEIVPGVELSTAYPGGRFHLLGYYINPESELIEALTAVQLARSRRNDIILEHLGGMGVELTQAEVKVYASEDGVLGRPHIARALVDKGYVTTVQEAFDRYLADGGPAYASKKVLSPEEAVRLIHEAGGVAIWAHPPRSPSKKITLKLDDLEQILRDDWLSWGLDGLEQWYSAYSEEEASWAATMAERYGLLGAGGSDFHGVSKPGVQLGVTHTGYGVPDEVLEQLKARRKN